VGNRRRGVAVNLISKIKWQNDKAESKEEERTGRPRILPRIERLYVIKGLTFDGADVYTKGKILEKEGVEVFYVLISSKNSTDI
jgi:hypothetical protein